MSEFDSPNSVEFVCDKRAEGSLRIFKYLLILGYAAFVAAFFLVCYITRFIPVFALCPVATWILVFFTWKYVSFDVYYTFEHGHMKFGKIKKRKTANSRGVSLEIDVQNAISVMTYKNALASDEYRGVKRVHDFSPGLSSENLLVIIYSGKSGREAVVFETTEKLTRLLTKFSPAAKSLLVS